MSTDSNGAAENEDKGVSRRTFLRATGVAAGAGILGLGTGTAAANSDLGARYFNWRAREARHAWERGYRGRTDRAIGLTDSGIEARHPDLGPWNGVRAVQQDGDLVVTTEETDAREREELDAAEDFSGSIGPGTFATPDVARHEFTVPKQAEETTASLSWSVSDVNDLEFYIENGAGERVASSASASMPETITAYLSGGETYTFVVETYASLATDYQIHADYFQYTGTLSAFEGNVFAGLESVDPDTPKIVGWYDHGSRYGSHDEPRDGNGHGTHCSSIMGGSGQASAVDADRTETHDPHATLALGDSLTYEVAARAETGVFASAYGEFVEVRIEGPSGKTLATSAVGIDDSSTWDNNVIDAPTVHGSGEATYTVHVTPYDGEILTAATIETVAVGAFLREDESVGDRLADGAGESADGVHSGVAPNASLVGLQGLGGATQGLADHAETFADRFNLRAVNMSWGYVGGAPLGAAGGLLTQDPTLIRKIADAGILVSAAAGNAATPLNGNGTPGAADEAISVVATGPLDGIASYSSGGIGAYDEDSNTVYRKPDVTAPGGTLTDLARAAKNGTPGTPEDEQAPIRDFTGKAGTSMAAPYVTGIAGVVSEAMESVDAPTAIRIPAPDETGRDDVLRQKQALLATATETALTAAPYHRAHTPTYEFGSRDPYEGYGRVNPGAAVDAVTRALSGTSRETVGLDVPEHERAAAGYVQAGPGTVDVSVSFSHYSGANKGAAEGAPHVDLFVYDAENPATNGEPNIVARTQALQGNGSVTVSLPRDSEERTFYVVAKLVNVPGVVNGYDVRAHLDLAVSVESGFFAAGSRADDGSVFTGGQTDQVDLTVNPSEKSAVRDVVPSAWTVLTDHSDDVARVEDAGDVQYVYFESAAAADTQTSVTYFVEAPSGLENSGEYAFGPAEVNPSDGWVAVSRTSDTNVVLGSSTDI